MDFVFNIIRLFGGLAFFLFGMNVMSGGLEKMAKGKLEKTLKSAASNKLLALFFGAVITIAIQSSSALTVMLVGLVNSGILEFGQTIGVLMGSNIGTTLTAWQKAEDQGYRQHLRRFCGFDVRYECYV